MNLHADNRTYSATPKTRPLFLTNSNLFELLKQLNTNSEVDPIHAYGIRP